MFNEIRTNNDIRVFLEMTNSLHDGFIIGVNYSNCGILPIENGYTFNHEQTKLVLQILVTSICDAVVEIVFENLLEWQIHDNQWDITETSVIFNEQNWIIWSDDAFDNMETNKKGSYIIARSMKWRIVE